MFSTRQQLIWVLLLLKFVTLVSAQSRPAKGAYPDSTAVTSYVPDISGHWHLYAENGRDSSLLTLDVLDNRAFFNKDQHSSPDKPFYDAYVRGYHEIFDTSLINVNVREACIMPFSWTQVPRSSRLTFGVISDNELSIRTTDNHIMRYTAIRSDHCRDKDLDQFNNTPQNSWFETTYQFSVTDWGNLDITGCSEDPYYEIFLGLHPTNPSVNAAQKQYVVLNFNKEIDIPFTTLPEKIKQLLNTIPADKRSRLTTRIYTDERIPLVYLQYLQVMLYGSGMWRISFFNTKGQCFLKRLRSYDPNPNMPSSALETVTGLVYYSDFCAPHNNISIETNYRWAESWVDPQLHYLPDIIPIAPDWIVFNSAHEIQVNIDNEGKIYVNGTETPWEQLIQRCYELLPKNDQALEMRVCLRAPYTLGIGTYLDVYSAILQAFYLMLQELSMANIGLSFDQITRDQRRELFQYLPPIIECMY